MKATESSMVPLEGVNFQPMYEKKRLRQSTSLLGNLGDSARVWKINGCKKEDKGVIKRDIMLPNKREKTLPVRRSSTQVSGNGVQWRGLTGWNAQISVSRTQNGFPAG